MKIILCETGKAPAVTEIENTLEAMQRTVGGYIETVHLWRDNVVLVCDEEGILKGLPVNRFVVPLLPIHGTFFLCGENKDEFDDVPEYLIDRYMRMMGDRTEVRG